MPNWNPNQEFRFIVPADYAELTPNNEGYNRIEWRLIDRKGQGVPKKPNPVHLTQNGKVSVSIQWPYDQGFTAKDSITFWQLVIAGDDPGNPEPFLDSTDDKNWRDGLDLNGVSQKSRPSSAPAPKYWIIYCAQSRNINVAAAAGVWRLTLALHVTVDGQEYKFICDPRMCVGSGCD